MIIPELLAPAGDLEKLKYAVIYGADAVYFGGHVGSLRTGAGNLSVPEIDEGVKYCHEHGVKAYLAVNILAHDSDFEALRTFLRKLVSIPVDAFIVSDPGVLSLIKEIIPGLATKNEQGATTESGPAIHISTQASVTNSATARFWYEQGAKRIVLARELSLAEIITLKSEIPDDLEIETFVHGAMCISYSGRCLLSNAMIGRDANRGDCAHPCRYSYSLMEEKRPEEYMNIEEDARGTYIFNSKDLCMIDHIDDLVNAGISSFKIEGRVKSIYYLSTVIRAYRDAIDTYRKSIENAGEFNDDVREFIPNPLWAEELTKVSNRSYTTGFFYGKPNSDAQNYESSGYSRDYTFVGTVLEFDSEKMVALVEQRNKFSVGEEIEIFGPGNFGYEPFVLKNMTDEKGNEIESAPHAQQHVYIEMPFYVAPHSLLRKQLK